MVKTAVKPQSNTTINLPENPVLHIGCGAQKGKMPAEFAGFNEVSFDIQEVLNPDIVGDMRDLSFLKDHSFAAIYSSHNIEHVFPHEVIDTLKGFYRIIKENGFLRIKCPDLGLIAQIIVQEDLDTVIYNSPAGPITPLDVMYGHIASIRKGETYMAHKTGFTAKTLASSLWAAGFRDIHIIRTSHELSAKAFRRAEGYDDKGQVTLNASFYNTPEWKARLGTK